MPDNSIDSPSSAYKAMQPFWQLVLDLLGGTPAMRAAGEKYLPAHPRESDEAWKARRDKTVLFNAFRKTLTRLANRPFSKPVVLAEGIPEWMDELLDDVDQLGSDITNFSRAAFKDGLGKGLTHILVDFPPIDESIRTRADEMAAKRRPYFVHVPAESLIAAYSETRDGQEHLTHIRIKESDVVRDGWGEVAVERVRVLEPGSWQVWERKGNAGWSLIDQGQTSLDFIPLVTFYSAPREGLMLAQPPLMDLAYKNLEHWQSSSDQRNVLSVARFPMLAASGVATESTITIGPQKLLRSELPESKFYYVEHSGAAIEAGRKDLEDLKDEMAALGVELLVRKSGTPTATEKSINASEATSELAAAAEAFADCLEHALWMASRFMGEEVDDDKLSVSIHTDFGLSDADASGLDVLFKARASGDISREAFLAELTRRGVLGPAFDVEEDGERLESEGPGPDDILAALANARSVAGNGVPSDEKAPGGGREAPGAENAPAGRSGPEAS